MKSRILLVLLLLLSFALAGCRESDRVAEVRFGVVADVQYADKDHRGSRRYREATGKLAQCIADWNGEDLAFATQLGDIIDGRAGVSGSLADLETVIAELKELRWPMHHVIGNHCLSVPRPTLMERLAIDRTFYDFAVGRWRFVVIDGMDVNLLDAGAGPEERRRVQEFLDEYPRARGRIATIFNGGVGREQIRWLESVLASADRNGDRVVLFCHLPVLAEAADEDLLLWNHEQIVGLCDEHTSVVAFFCGHHHDGGYAERRGVHYVTFPAVCTAPADGNAYAVVEAYADRLVIRGVGDVPSRGLPIRSAR